MFSRIQAYGKLIASCRHYLSQRSARDLGASFLEYAILLTLIVVAAIAAVEALKTNVSTQLSGVASNLT